MKTLLLLTLLLFTLLHSQANTTSLCFYPLQTGNYWEYEQILNDVSIGIIIHEYYTIEVMRDTILPNGLKYKFLKRGGIPIIYGDDTFERIDSLTGNVYRYDSQYLSGEILIDSLMCEVGDTIMANRFDPILGSEYGVVCNNISPINIFNLQILTKNIQSNFIFFPQEYSLAKNLGLVFFCESTWNYLDTLRLVYAKIDGIEYGTPVSVDMEIVNNKIKSFDLRQNYPNPFNPKTVIEYTLPKSEKIKIILYNNLGQKIEELYSGKQQSGHHKIELDGSKLPSGIYYYGLRSAEFSDTKKCILLK